MHDLYLLNLIVRREDGEPFADFLNEQGMETVHSLPCRGTAGKRLLSVMGLEETEKTLLWTMTSRSAARRLLSGLVREMGLDMPGVITSQNSLPRIIAVLLEGTAPETGDLVEGVAILSVEENLGIFCLGLGGEKT